jgi:hypothetical protein
LKIYLLKLNLFLKLDFLQVRWSIKIKLMKAKLVNVEIPPDVNLINILRAHFAPIFWYQKLQSCVLGFKFLAPKQWHKMHL